MIKDLEELEVDPDTASLSGHNVLKEDVSVREAISANFGLGKLEETHVEQADLVRPLIYAEIAPDSFNLIDGHHRLAKADQQGIETLPAYFVYAHAAVNYLSSEEEYCQYVEYWNQKVEDYDRPDFPGIFCPIPAPQLERDLHGGHVWERLLLQMEECRRVELYNEGTWFTLFRLNGRIYCGEAEDHRHSIKCASPFAITKEAIGEAAHLFEDWQRSEKWDKSDRKERRKQIRKKLKHADVVMACVRVFSEYGI